MNVKDIPPSAWSALIVSTIIPLINWLATQIKSSINTDFNISTAWSKINKNILESIEKTPDNSFAKIIALNSISQSLILSSSNAIYKASRPQSPITDWLCVFLFGILSALSGHFLPRPLNIIFAIIFLGLLAAFEFSALLRSELNKQFKKFIRFCLVDNINSKVLLENPEIAYQIFEREARRSAYRTSPLISSNYANWPEFWKVIKKIKLAWNKIFIFEVSENRYGIILKYIIARQKEIYKNF